MIATSPRTNLIAQLSSGILSGQAFSLMASHKAQLSTTCSLHTSKVMTLNEPFPNKDHDTQNLSLGLISPWFISGFADAEGSLVVIVRKNNKFRLGWRVEIVFRIGLHKRDLALLEQIQAYFGGIGSIVKQGKDVVAYRVSSHKDILNYILPHFDKYPLITHKREDYLLWREVVLKMKAGQHLLTEGLQDIVNLRAFINLGLSEDLKIAFPNTISVSRPVLEEKDRLIPHAEWVAGFTTGEGCFYILNKVVTRSE